MTIQGNFYEGNAFIIVENDMNRVTAEGTGPFFDQVNVYERIDDSWWDEILVWDAAEWREGAGEAFEAIIGVISRVVGGVRIERF